MQDCNSYAALVSGSQTRALCTAQQLSLGVRISELPSSPWFKQSLYWIANPYIQEMLLITYPKPMRFSFPLQRRDSITASLFLFFRIEEFFFRILL